MHEERLARHVARTLKSRGLSIAQVRLNVRGGRTDPVEFEEALRAQLVALLPEDAKSVAAIEVRRAPFAHVCPGCGHGFEAAEIAAACPSCGAESLAELSDEEIDVERLERVR